VGCAAVRSSVMQYGALCCSVVHFAAACCCVLECDSVLNHGALCCSVVQCVAVCCCDLQCVAARCFVSQRGVLWCSMLQYGAVCCSMVQCVAVWCSVLLSSINLRGSLVVLCGVCIRKRAHIAAQESSISAQERKDRALVR